MKAVGFRNFDMENSNITILELFAGIGGLATAWPESTVLTAYDISQLSAQVYRANHPHPFVVRSLESIADGELASHGADLWWLSPPCQPFTVKGKRQDRLDSRNRGLLHLIELLRVSSAPPPFLALENVFGFEESDTAVEISTVLRGRGYQLRGLKVCPTQLGWPNRRPRFYLLATTRNDGWSLRPHQPRYQRTLNEMLEADLLTPSAYQRDYWLSESTVQKYGGAISRVDPHAAQAHTACFGASYGKALMRAGSYLQVGRGYRRFTPREVARLLGFPDSFRLSGLTDRQAWKLLGNSLSLPAVRYVLSHFSIGPDPGLPWHTASVDA